MLHNRDSASLLDILYSAKQIHHYIEGMDEEAFYQDEKTQSAVIHRILLIGEAANRVSKEFQTKHTNIPWREIIGMRNLLIHTYDEVNLSMVWYAATHSVPGLIVLLEPLVPPP